MKSRLIENGVTSLDLGEVVHEAATRFASASNADGMDAQLEALALLGYGDDEIILSLLEKKSSGFTVTLTVLKSHERLVTGYSSIRSEGALTIFTFQRQTDPDPVSVLGGPTVGQFNNQMVPYDYSATPMNDGAGGGYTDYVRYQGNDRMVRRATGESECRSISLNTLVDDCIFVDNIRNVSWVYNSDDSICLILTLAVGYLDCLYVSISDEDFKALGGSAGLNDNIDGVVDLYYKYGAGR